jgi:hypothetical protein
VLRRADAIRTTRRSLLGLGAGLCLPIGLVDEAGLRVHDVVVPDCPPTLRRSRVILPSELPSAASLPILVLLHGLGETTSPELGLSAWPRAYGLALAWERLRRGEVKREEYDYLSASDFDELNTSLQREPFRGLCVVCPFLPNPYAGGGWQRSLERYADWLTNKLLPTVRNEFGSAVHAERAGIAGVSLGGFSALEVFLQRPKAWATVGTIQGAFSKIYAQAAARRLRDSGRAPAVYVATSTFDPYRAANEAFVRALEAAGANVSLRIRKGPHSQGWLREIGTLDALLWHDRALR